MTSTYIRLRLPTFGNREMSETGREATALVQQHVSHHNDFDKIYLKTHMSDNGHVGFIIEKYNKRIELRRLCQ